MTTNDERSSNDNKLSTTPLIKKHKRLAVFMPGLNGGGAERTMLNLADGIARRGFSVDLVLASADGPYMNQVPKSLHVVDLGRGRFPKAKRTLMSLPALVRYLRRRKPDAMLSILCRANLVALWARRLSGVSTPIVISERNTISHWARQRRAWQKRLALQLARRVYHWADAVTTVSEGVADDLSRETNIRRDRIQVIYNPVATPELRRKAQASLNHPWFRPGEPRVILAVGNLSKQKDFHTLIKAFARLPEVHSERLLILGEGKERPALENLVARLELEQKVSLPGWMDNPYPFMARSALFVLSSRWEGLPGVLIEAMFCGTPLIATDCPSGPREILADGQYGQLVPVGDVGALARAMEAALSGKLPPPPRESWRRYELDSVARQYLHLLFGTESCVK